jgi:hypothetical protein
MVLDQLESLKKSSYSGSSFIHIDESQYEVVKKELIQLLNSTELKDESIQEKKKVLIGTLPYVLMDKTKFPTNQSIVKLADESLNYKISTWKKRGREEMIGLIISRIAEDNENQFEVFMDLWKKFITNGKIIENSRSNREFVDIWLEFFNHNRDSN